MSIKFGIGKQLLLNKILDLSQSIRYLLTKTLERFDRFKISLSILNLMKQIYVKYKEDKITMILANINRLRIEY